MTLYKVVGPLGESIHGGAMQWSLPNGQPGEWSEVEGSLVLCEHGLHLTDTPIAWWREGSRVFEVEHEGELLGGTATDNKVCARRARLIREVPWSQFQVFSDGVHTVTDGLCIALGYSSVVARDNSSVVARDNSSVEARGYSSVEAWDNSSVVLLENSSVEAWDNSSVVARDNSSVVARDNSSVEAWDNSSVVARDNSSVEAWDNSSVEAWDNSSVVARDNSTTISPRHWGSHAVTLGKGTQAVWVDRRGAAVVVHTAEPA